MIAQLRGLLLHKDPPLLVVEAAGVGYELEAPLSTWSRLPELGQEVSLRTHLVIREDQHLLYGFATEAERRLFRDLLKVNGVGPKIALAMLSAMTVDNLLRCIQSQDTAALVKVPGIGRKTAERLIVDLKDRVEQLTGLAAAVLPADRAPVDSTAQGEALDALVSLGYKPGEARRLLEQVGPRPAGSTADLLRAALRAAAR
jgi:Holliday junction DNA helicase RuvA